MNIIKGGKSSLPTPHLQICSYKHEDIQSLCEDTRPSSPLLVTIWQQPVKHKNNYFLFCSVFHAVTARRKNMDIYVCKAKQSIPALSISPGLSRDAVTTLHHNWTFWESVLNQHFSTNSPIWIPEGLCTDMAIPFDCTYINTTGQSSVAALRLSLHSKHLSTPLQHWLGDNHRQLLAQLPLIHAWHCWGEEACMLPVSKDNSQHMTSAHAPTLLVFLIAFGPLQFTLSTNMGRN